MMVLSLTCLSIAADIKSPTFNVVGDGELVSANKNMIVALLVGILVAAIYGIFTMVFSFLPLQMGTLQGTEAVYLILSLLMVVILACSVTALFANSRRDIRRSLLKRVRSARIFK